jgi:non-ribosomal peptide synthase protein (TIGR01720 family)
MRTETPGAPPAGIHKGIGFNFLGDFSPVGQAQGDKEPLFGIDNTDKGPETDGSYEKDSLLDIIGISAEGQLTFTISYSTAQYKEETIAKFAGEYEYCLKQLILRLSAIHDEKQARKSEAAIRGVPLLSELSYNQQLYTTGEDIHHAYGASAFFLEPFDRQRFLAAYQYVLECFEMLRIRFSRTGGVLYQEILPADETRNKLVFVEEETLDIQRISTARFVHELTQTPFDLFNGEILRCAVIRAKEQALVCFAIHHVAVDGSSHPLIEQAFKQKYYGSDAGDRPASTHYFLFTTLQQKYLEAGIGRTQMAYWEDHLKTIGQNYKRQNGAIAAETEFACIRNTISVTGEGYRRLAGYCKENDLLQSSLVLAVIYSILRDEFEQKDEQLIEVIVDGRDLDIPGIDIRESVGQYVNRLPVRLESRHELELSEVAPYVQERYLSCRLHQQVPYRRIESAFRQQYGLELRELTDASVNYVQRPGEQMPDNGAHLSAVVPLEEAKGLNINAECYSYPDGIHLVCHIKVEKERALPLAGSNYFIEKLNAAIEKFSFASEFTKI